MAFFFVFFVLNKMSNLERKTNSGLQRGWEFPVWRTTLKTIITSHFHIFYASSLSAEGNVKNCLVFTSLSNLLLFICNSSKRRQSNSRACLRHSRCVDVNRQGYETIIINILRSLKEKVENITRTDG